MPDTVEGKRGNKGMTPKGRATRAALLDAAHSVFKEKGFYGSSISEITRRCGVSMGTFYQYFKNKEQAFQELNALIVARFMEKINAAALDEMTFEERLKAVLQILYSHCRENLAFHTVLGESELIDSVTIAYYESIAEYYRNFFLKEARSGFVFPLDPDIIAYALIGICYFHSLDWKSGDEDFSASQILELTVDFVLNGINGPAPWKRQGGEDLLWMPEPTAMRQVDSEPMTKGEKTRYAIFSAAEKVIGRYGINRANIFEITREAGVAQGTFYVHFDSKNDLIEGFVKYFNHQLRRELQRVVSKMKDRRDAERVGILKFFDYVSRHRQLYRIIPECEIISREVSLWYYGKIVEGYIHGLRQGVDRGEIRSLPPVFLARTLMGLTHFLALKWIIWNGATRDLFSPSLLSDILRFLMFGLRPLRQ